MRGAKASFTWRISFAMRFWSAGSKAIFGLSIMPVMLTPSRASRLAIADEMSPRYSKLV